MMALTLLSLILVAQSPATPAAPTLLVGAEVEITGGILYGDLDAMKVHKTTGSLPASAGGERRYFGLMTGTRGKVQETTSEATRVQIVNGSWSGRSGWVPRAEV